VVEINPCRHLFCWRCIDSSIKHNHNTCPIDRIEISDLGCSPRIIPDLLSQLRIKCELETYGCETVCQLSQIIEHEKTCNYRSDTMVLRYIDCKTIELIEKSHFSKIFKPSSKRWSDDYIAYKRIDLTFFRRGFDRKVLKTGNETYA
jgi:hypothetical protein